MHSAWVSTTMVACANRLEMSSHCNCICSSSQNTETTPSVIRDAAVNVDDVVVPVVLVSVTVGSVVTVVVVVVVVAVVAVVAVVVVVVVEATSLSGSFVVCSTYAQFPERCDFNSPTSIPGALYALQYCACLSKWQHCTPLIVLQKARQAWFVKSNMNDRAKSVSLLATVQTRFIVNALHVTVKGVSLLSVTTAAKVVVVAVDIEGVVVSGPADCAAAAVGVVAATSSTARVSQFDALLDCRLA